MTSNGEPGERADLKRLLLRLAQLEARVHRLEAARTDTHAAPPESIAVEPLEQPRPEPQPQSPPVPPPAAEPVSSPEAAFTATTPPLEAEPVPEAADIPAATGETADETVDVLEYRPRRTVAEPVESGALEQAIGLRWSGWIGALIVVIGAVLAVKYAYDAGWIGQIPAAIRLIVMAVGGFALIAAGEWVYRRVSIVSAVGLFASGVGTLFLVAYAGYSILDVYGRETAFALMLIASLIGSAVAMRGRLVSIAVLSQLGGHLTPLILGGDPRSAVPLLSYLLMLQAVALFLAWWGGSERWWTLRWLATAATSLWVAALLIDGSYETSVIFGFVLAFAGLFFVEVLLSAIRPSTGGEGAERRFTAAHAGSVFLVVVAALLVLATLYSLRESSPAVRGLWLIAYAIALAAIGFTIPAIARPLPLALRALAAALVVLAVPVALRGPAVSLLWGLMAMAFGVLASRWNLRVSRVASVAVWAGAVGYLAWATHQPHVRPSPDDTLFTLWGAPMKTAMLLGWTLAAMGLVVAWQGSLDRTRADGVAEEPAVPVTVAALASLVWVGAAWLFLPPAGATLAIVLLAWLLAGLDRLLPRLLPAAMALALLLIAAVKWAMLDLLAQRLGEGWSAQQLDYTAVLNPVVAVGSLIAGSFPAIAWLRRATLLPLADRGTRTAGTRPLLIGAALAFGLVLGFGLTLEIDRIITSVSARNWPLDLAPGHVRQLSFTLLWCVLCGIGTALVWRLDPDPIARQRTLIAPYAVAMLLAVKFLVVDTLAWRAMGLGRATVLLNLESLVAVAVLGLLVPLYLQTRRDRAFLPKLGGFLALLTILWLGMMEIDRGIAAVGASPLTLQLAVTLWWSTLAISLVLAGLFLRIAGMRYFGLTLFALTLAKLFVVDLRFLDRGWRTLAFIATGLFLIGTSVVYGKYSSRLLRGRNEPPSSARPPVP